MRVKVRISQLTGESEILEVQKGTEEEEAELLDKLAKYLTEFSPSKDVIDAYRRAGVPITEEMTRALLKATFGGNQVDIDVLQNVVNKEFKAYIRKNSG